MTRLESQLVAIHRIPGPMIGPAYRPPAPEYAAVLWLMARGVRFDLNGRIRT